jgi:hypothetical protein
MRGLSPEKHDLLLLGIDEILFIRRAVQRTGLVFSGTLGFVVLLLSSFKNVSPMLLVILVLCVPSCSWIIPIRKISKTAEVRRADMDLAVAVYLDLVNVLLAGGAGVETAMLAAASAGDGWSFEKIRLALARAQSSRSSYWDSLRELGAETQVDSLEEVASSVQLAGEQGARIRQSLGSKANALRARNLARIEHEAEQRTEHMGLPIVLLFFGFILLIGYPAFVGTIGAL